MKLISLPKFIFYTLAIGIIFNVISLYFSQGDLEDMYTPGGTVSGWYYQLDFVGNALISLTAVISFLLYNKYYPTFVSVCYISLIILVLICSIGDFTYVYRKPSFIYSIRGLGTFINFGLIFFAANTEYFKKILRLFYVMCFLVIVAAVIGLGKVGAGATRMQYLFAIRDYTVVLMWVFPFFFLQDEPNKKLNLLNMAAFAMIFIFVLSTGARTYLVIYFIYLFVKFKEQLRSKNALLVIIATIVIGAGTFLALAKSDLSKTIDGAITNLSERKDEDSRSGQIIEFIQQWDPEYLVQGVGPRKAWFWTGVADYYYFLDNQFLLMGWWAGLPALFVYLYLLGRTYFTRPEILLFEEVKGIKLLIFLWVMACLGFAIYITISSSLYYYFLDLLMGYHLCKFTLLKNPEEFEEA